MLKRVSRVLLAAALLVSARESWSQAIFATLTGIVTDPSGAVIPGAKITLRNAGSGDTRETTANGQGYYTFASVAVGTYNLSVTAGGFETFVENNIALGGGEARNVNVTLTVGSSAQTVTVSSAVDMLTPVDSGEKTITITEEELKNYVQQGSNAAEYLKIMPGFGIQNGTSNVSNYTGSTIGINANGDAGSQSPLNNAFSYNGLPGNTLDIVSDGAHVADPGCNCDTPVNPNSDFLEEFKVQTSNFSAEDQKGPMVITSVTKAGGANYHGSGFFTARNYVLNSNDAYSNALGIPKPHNVYYYPGASIGGPVLIPGTGFNKNRDKVFFYTGFEYFYQVLDTGDLTATVPTPGMLNGDFSDAQLSQLGTKTASGGPAGPLRTNWPNGQMPANLIDPSMQALMKLYPAPNANPAATGGFNYVEQEIFNQNDTQWVIRGDYAVSDNTKIWVRYNLQRETQLFPTTVWGTPTDGVPYPTSVAGKNSSDSIAGTLTHVFNPSLTNETVIAYSLIKFPNIFEDPAKVDRAQVGYKDPTLFNNGVAQIPSIGGNIYNPSEAAAIYNFGGFNVGGNSQGLFANKYMPSGSDTLTYIWRKHTFKAGGFFEWIRNSQPDSNANQGELEFFPSGNPTFTYGDAYADMLAGNITSYTEYNFDRLNEISYWQLEGFLQDAWKVNPNLTIDAGLRVTHFEPWVDDLGYGFSIFNPALYNSANDGACASGPTFCGFEWHSRTSSVPVGGFPTRALFYQPRLGFAYDLTGGGRTVLRGGWGMFYYHTGQTTAGLGTSAGEEGITLTPTTIGNRTLFASQLNDASFTAVPATPTGVDSKDDRQPYTMAYNLTIAQRTPWAGLLELAYVGNVTRDLPSTGGFGSDINLVPVGAMLSAANPGSANGNDYRPYAGYAQLNLLTNNLYSNFNGLQASWAHQNRNTIIQLNYTWSKALGIVGASSSPTLGSYGATLNPFNLRANYGALPGDRRQIFNAVYSLSMPNLYHGSKFVGGLVNGWQISGISQLESGANLTGNAGAYNFNMQLNGAILPGSQNVPNPGGAPGIPINNQAILGTPDIQLNPILTCNPRSGLAPHQYINGSCFQVPTTVGQNGPTVLPAIYGPAYFNSDLGVFKNFQITESRKLQFRVQAQNFLNHPLYSFPNTNNLSLNFAQNTPGGTTINQTNPDFGIAQFKQGSRIIEMVARFYF